MRKYDNLVIRSQRVGRKHQPFYYIVVINRRNRARGKFVEKLGYYSNNPTESAFVINLRRVGHWTNIGARVHWTIKKKMQYFIIPR